MNVVNQTTDSFSRYILTLSIVVILVFVAGAVAVFLHMFKSRERRFDKDISLREHMLELLVQNSRAAFALFEIGQNEPLFYSSNCERIFGEACHNLEKTGAGYRMSSSSDAETDALKEINLQMTGWDGKHEFRSTFLRNAAAATPAYFEIQLYPVENSGEKETFVGIAQDVTPLYERQAIAAEALAMAEKANQAKTHFLSSMSHDIRTPMNAIVNMTDFALESIDDSVLIDYVFMDTKRLQYEEVKEVVYRDILSRMEKKPFDYVIAADDAALTFVLEYRDELFADIPVVFEGINDEEFAYEAAKDPLITGIVELFPLEETVFIASCLTPEAVQVIGITDDTVSGHGSTKQFFACEDSFPDLSFSTINCSELTYDEIGRAVAQYGSDTILIYLMMTDDVEGNTYSHTEATEYVAACANVPVYKADELGLGDSVLGNVMTSYYDMAADAASIVVALAQGASISSFPVQTASYYCAFDKAVMDRFGITKEEVSAACSSKVQ